MMNLKNKFVMAPIKTGYSDGSGVVTIRHKDFFLRRSPFLGAITLEPLYMHKSLRELPTQIGLDADVNLAPLKELIHDIQKDDTKVIAHLNHPGRMANPKIPGNVWLSSTDIACENGGAKPKRMTKNDMDDVINLYVESIKRAEDVGFNIIELQFGHGYLMAQFLSPAVNNRTDEYGGSFENRVRFPLEVIKAVSETASIPIIARISGSEMLPKGFSTYEMKTFSSMLVENGISAIHVSAGTICSTPPWFFQHMFVPKGKTWEFANDIKKSISKPVIFVGQINTNEDIKILETKYDADYIALGRALIADPDFVGKLLGQIKGIQKPCLACSEGCLGGVKAGKGLQCLVNPLVGNDMEKIEKAVETKNIAVVGGGLAGMEAALTLTQRGHSVDLFEKNQLGGQFNLASLPPKKASLKKIVTYYKSMILSNDINVIKKEATEDDLIDKNYDEVFLATGGEPAIPPIKGLKHYFWAEVLLDHNLPENKNILVIGGGLIGIEIAHKLLTKNNTVTIVEMLQEVARGMEMISKLLTMKDLKEKGAKIYANTKVTSVDEDKVTLIGDINTTLSDIDHIILTTGMKSYNPLEEKLKGKITTITIGDAKQVGKAQDAIKSAYNSAKIT